MTRILIADDHPLFRQALAQAVAGLGEIKVDESDRLDATLARLAEPPPVDLVLLDLHMPGSRGLTGLAAIRCSHPEVAVVVISANDDPGVVRRALDQGAAGFIPKRLDPDTLAEALKAVLDCETWVPPHLRDPVAARAPVDDDPAAAIARLTPQQFRVLEMVAEGRLNKQIADALGIQERTVKAHMSEIFNRLGVRNRTQAGIAFRRLDLVEPGHAASAANDDRGET